MDVAKLQNFYLGFYEWGKKKLIARGIKRFVKSNLSNRSILTAEEKQQAVSFWAPYVKIDPVFHSFYKEKTGIFHPAYLPKDVYMNRVDEYFNIRSASWWLDHKCLYPRLFAGIPQADNVMFRMGGFWYDSQWQALSQEQALELAVKEPALVMKAATRSVCGNGVLFIAGESNITPVSFTQALQQQPGDIVVQRPLQQHESFAALHGSSVNTLRVLSLLTEEGPKIYSVIVRMGGSGEKIDNSIATGLFCGVQSDGTLAPVAYRLNGDKFTAHPTSGLVFAGHKLAGVEKAKALVKKAAPMLPLFKLVSWDIVIDTEGEPLMLECNLAKGSIHYHQLTNGPVFGEDTRKIMDQVFNKK